MDFDSQRRDPRRQALMEALHGRLPQGVAVFDVGLRLVYANLRWSFFLEHVTTTFRDPSPGTRFADLLPGADDLSAAALECARTGETVHLPGRRASTHAGETFWDITLAPLITGQLVSGVICVVDDATARLLAEHAAAAKVRLAAFRADVSQALAGSDEIDAVLQSCAEVMVRHAAAAFARIWVLDEAERVYRLRASAGLYTRLDGSYSRIPTDWLRPEDRRFLASEPGVAVDLLRTHQVADPAWAAKQGLVSWASHPLIARGHLVGFMVMFARQNFDEDTLSELAAIADAIAQFVQRKHAESALQEAYERLEQRVAERTQELSLLLEISRNVASTLELQPLLELILEQLKSVADYTDTAVFTLEDDHLVITGHRGPLSEEEARKTRYPVARLAPVWDRLSRGEAIVIHDVRGESLEARVFRAVVGEAVDGQLGFIRSCLLAPLVVKERLIGLMAITRGEPNVFEPGQIEMAAAIARQAAVAIENARLHEQARHVATLEERQRLARELHDSVAQTLFGIRLTAQSARTLLDRDPTRAAAPLDSILSLAEGGIAETRALVFALRPDALATEGLVAALVRQVQALRTRHELDVEAALGAEPNVPREVKEALYRIAQEALHNTVKHARATRVDVRLTCDPAAVSLELADNGVGFDPTQDFPGHLGQTSMRERAEQLGGTLAVRSAPGQGTRIAARIPLPAVS
ncbi:MAG: GAF domain-containing protein [Dehalococcoidia bacterium]